MTMLEVTQKVLERMSLDELEDITETAATIQSISKGEYDFAPESERAALWTACDKKLRDYENRYDVDIRVTTFDAMLDPR